MPLWKGGIQPKFREAAGSLICFERALMGPFFVLQWAAHAAADFARTAYWPRKTLPNAITIPVI